MKLLSIVSIVLLCFVSGNAEVSEKQAKKAIATAAGVSFPSSAVRVERITSSSNGSAEVSTQLELVFRLSQDDSGQWRIKELRTGEDHWEDVQTIAKAFEVELQPETCDPEKNQYGRKKPEGDLSIKRARCLVANLFAVQLPSDAVRIREVSGLGLAPHPSAVAVTLVQADFRLAKKSGNWQAVEFHSGSRDWLRLDSVRATVDAQKRVKTMEDLNAIATALLAYRQERGTFVISDKHSVLIDHLNPHYLSRVIRLDAWHRPLSYFGDTNTYTLRSLGPDGKEDTPDDIVVSIGGSFPLNSPIPRHPPF
jgi:hypothetical protein